MEEEQIVGVDEVADRNLECKAGIAEAIIESSVFGPDVFVLTNRFDCQASDSEITFD